VHPSRVVHDAVRRFVRSFPRIGWIVQPMKRKEKTMRTTKSDLPMFRVTFSRIVGQDERALSDQDRSRVVESVQNFTSFTEDNDPYGEHDFGTIALDGIGWVFWKIDYYDPSFTYASDDPADPTKTRRVLTIMLAEEY
jgi:hypothetical protein